MTTRKSKSKKAATKSAKRTMIRGATASKEPLPQKIFANVSPRSIGGVSMFEAQNQIHSATITNFFSEGEVIDAAVRRLQEGGFDILQISPLTINIAGTPAQYRRAFGTNLVVEDRPVIKEGARKDVAQFLDTPDTAISGLIETQGTQFEDSIEGIALEEPRYYMAASSFAPLKSYWHLRMPGDVSLACNADKAHRAGITGKGIKVAMCDSGWFKHPYFVGRGYRAAPVVLGPAATLPLKDESGHGTGESANIFANAPDVDFMPVKMNFVNSTGAFNAAVGLGPNIITCSWGSSTNGPLSAADQVLAAAIAAAVAAGIIVVFSAGNGHAGFPGQHPDVISAGGVFMNPNETLQASNYSSGFLSQIYPGRRVPDVCGLVGMKPKAIYIMLPLEPGDQIDVGNAGLTHPNGDETTNSDGWAAFSGTSAAAPQLAGVAALIKQACPGLSPKQVRNIMMSTARDVTTGNANSVPGGPAGGHPATVGPDLATGTGLVDAHKAVMVAKVQCLGPIIVGPPITPIVGPAPITGPVTPITGPVTPITGPVTPITGPVTPITGPVTPITGPVRPITGPVTPITGPVVPITGPVTPITGPVRPITVQPIFPPITAPVVNPGPARPGGMEGTGGEGQGSSSALSAEDVETLSELIINSELDVD
ncbi:MAG TPA: S8 family serine peptidase [Pyrinomonadaceae bacterium]|nr:S8 family serine peptidase [Pyrinomonadaceae bacterium]